MIKPSKNLIALIGLLCTSPMLMGAEKQPTFDSKSENNVGIVNGTGEKLDLFLILRSGDKDENYDMPHNNNRTISRKRYSGFLVQGQIGDSGDILIDTLPKALKNKELKLIFEKNTAKGSPEYIYKIYNAEQQTEKEEDELTQVKKQLKSCQDKLKKYEQ